jgi:hypothetical protein
MSSIRARLKMLKRIAQTTDATTSTTSPDTTTPVPATSNNTAVPPDPSPPASSLYPIIRTGWDPARVVIVDQLCKILSSAANVATNGTYNLQNLRNENFQFDASSFGSPDQKNLMLFFQKVYKTLLNNGQSFTAPLNANQVKQMVPYLLQSPELANLSTVNPTGQIAQKAPAGNFKDNIRDLVARLQPTITTRRA